MLSFHCLDAIAPIVNYVSALEIAGIYLKLGREISQVKATTRHLDRPNWAIYLKRSLSSTEVH